MSEDRPRAPTFERVTPRLLVPDLAAVMQFYVRELGFDVDVLWPPEHPTFVILRRDAVHISFFTGERAMSDHRGYAELYVEVSDAEQMHRALAPRVEIAWGPEVYSYGRREFAVLDPEGTMVIFTEPTTDEPTTDEPASGEPTADDRIE